MPRRDVGGLASFQSTRLGVLSPTTPSPRPSYPPSHTPVSASKCNRDDIVKVEDDIDVVGYDFLNEQI